MKLIDLTGQQFGQLTVIERIQNNNKRTMWLCRCSCGNVVAVSAANLRQGLSRSCGGTSHRMKDRTGERFGNLVALKIDYERSSKGKVFWVCKCDCGKTTSVLSSSLANGNTRSCGCLQKRAAAETGKHTATHHKSKTRLYRVWRGIKSRGFNSNDSHYAYYGGRGIQMCEEWRDSYESFEEWAMQNGYKPDAQFGECTIDRVNVDGNYEPSNCRWVDLRMQASNRRVHDGNTLFTNA